MNGEIGRYENVRYIEQTNIAKGIGSTGIATASGGDMVQWTNGQSDWIFFFGNDTVAEGVAVPEEMRGKIPPTTAGARALPGITWAGTASFIRFRSTPASSSGTARPRALQTPPGA